MPPTCHQKIDENLLVTDAGQSRELWEEMGARWAAERELLWAGTRPVSEWLVTRLQARAGETVLELAAGTGDTGFLVAGALGSNGRLLTSDRSHAMLAGARARAAELGVMNVDFLELDSDKLALADECVDAVISRFGYLLKGEAPLAEVRRVLRPGGRLVCAVWAERSRNAWMTVPRAALAAVVGSDEQTGRDLLAGRSLEGVRAAVAGAGFVVAEITELDVAYRFATEAELWAFASELRGPVAVAISELDAGKQAEVRAELERLSPRDASGSYALPGVAIVSLAT